MYKKYDDKTLVSIIDYKTGNTDIDIYNSVYGIGMQLIVQSIAHYIGILVASFVAVIIFQH